MTKEIVSGVYCLHCIATGKKYIGASTNIANRIISHKSASKTSNLPLYEDVRKYGWDNIIIGIVEEESDIDKLNQKEDYYIHKYDVINNGYNSQRSKPVPNEETKKRMSESHKGRDLTEDTRRRISESNKGQKRSQETKKRMSEAHKGIPGIIHTEETRKKISSIHKGRVLTEDWKRKISESKKGTVISEDTRKKMSESLKGRVFSTQHKRKISEAKKNQSEETRKKIAESNRHTFIIHNRITDTTFEVTNLKEWCSDKGMNYRSLHNTLSKGNYTKSGYRIISST